ncbi:MAG: MBL fold metallo-hydrolase [bacterium]
MLKYFNSLLVIVLISISFYRYYTNNSLSIYYFNIGQGDSSLVITPDNKTILIDGGPDKVVLTELGKVLPFWSRNLDLVILSHPDLDHIGGLTQVIQRYQVKEIILNSKQEAISLEDQFFQEEIIRQKISPQIAQRGDRMMVGCCTVLNFFSKDMIDYKGKVSVNARSLAFVLSYQGVDFFYGGDLDTENELEVATNITGKIEIVKISHHGSKYSSSAEFFEKLKPEFAIISVGKDNRFGHPHQETLSLLEKEEISWIRTDEKGTIKIEVKEGNYQVTSNK